MTACKVGTAAVYMIAAFEQHDTLNTYRLPQNFTSTTVAQNQPSSNAQKLVVTWVLLKLHCI
jgi:hypothetical protein